MVLKFFSKLRTILLKHTYYYQEVMSSEAVKEHPTAILTEKSDCCGQKEAVFFSGWKIRPGKCSWTFWSRTVTQSLNHSDEDSDDSDCRSVDLC